MYGLTLYLTTATLIHAHINIYVYEDDESTKTINEEHKVKNEIHKNFDIYRERYLNLQVKTEFIKKIGNDSILKKESDHQTIGPFLSSPL